MSTPDPATTDWVPVWSLGSTLADLRYNGAHVPGNAYTDGDIVFSGGVAYLCVRPTTATPAPWTVGIAPLPAVPRAKATRATALTLSNGAWQALTWDGEEFDTDAIHDTATNTQRLTCKTAGVYAFTSYAILSGGTIGTLVSTVVMKNSDAIGSGVAAVYIPAVGGISLSSVCTGIVTLALNDWLTAMHFQNGTGTWTMVANSYFSMWRIA